MLTPDYLAVVGDDVVRLYEQYQQVVLNDIARRLAKLDYAKPAAAWQLQRLNESSMVYKNAIAELSRLTGRTQAELRRIFTDAGVTSLKFDDAIYRRAGLTPIPLNLSPAMLAVLQAGLSKTAGLVQNFTNTTALGGYDLFKRSADMVYMMVSTGAFDYQTALRYAIKNAAAEGLSVVNYASGHRDHLDVALRRAILTGVNQTSGKLQEARADEMNCDLVQTSAHIGARNTGVGPANHESWQGKIFSRSGAHPKYPDFIATTGYGTGDGLMGWNCRHSWFPFFEGISAEHYAEEELAMYKNKKVRYNGKDLNFYEATQQQRAIERKIRYWKRQEGMLSSAGLDASMASSKVAHYQSEMRSFIKQTGLQRQRFREQVFRPKPGDPKIFKAVEPKPDVPTPAPKPPPSAEKSLRDKLLENRYTIEDDPERMRGFFESQRVHIEDDGYAIRKPDTSHFDIKSLSKREAFADDVDELLGTNIVPTTVWRESDNASFQEMIDDCKPACAAASGWVVDPEDFGKQGLLDAVLGNTDRHDGNFLITRSGKLVSIDHGLSMHKASGRSASLYIDENYEHLKRYADWFEGMNELFDRLPLKNSYRDNLVKLHESGSLEKLARKYGFDDWEIELMNSRIEFLIDNWDSCFVEI